jgi:hypothetical protein
MALRRRRDQFQIFFGLREIVDLAECLKRCLRFGLPFLWQRRLRDQFHHLGKARLRQLLLRQLLRVCQAFLLLNR